jgi:Ran GTPase-activating protein (RanGAP) involved in mRNA processing and transport
MPSVTSLCNLLHANETIELDFDIANVNGIIISTEQDVDSLVEAFEQNTSLRGITLTNRYYGLPAFRTCEDAKWPPLLLRAIGRLASLRELRRVQSKLDENDVHALLTGLQEREGLKTFVVGRYVVFHDQRTYEVLIQSLTALAGLQELALSECHFYPHVSTSIAMPLEELAQALPSWPNLKSIVIRSFRNSHTKENTLASFASALGNTQSLETFRLDYYAPGTSTGNGFTLLMETLAHIPTLQSFTCAFCSLNNMEAYALAHAVRHSESLKHVDLRDTFAQGCGTPYGADYFADLFASNSIKTIDLSDAHFTPERVESIVCTLKGNYVLERVDTSHCSGVDVSAMVENCIRTNQESRQKMIDPSCTASQQLDLLIKAKDHLGSLFYLFRENPGKDALLKSALY